MIKMGCTQTITNQKISKSMKLLWEDPDFRKKQKKARSKKSYSEKRAKIINKIWMNGKTRKNMKKRISEGLQKPEVKASKSESMKKVHKENKKFNKKALKALEKGRKRNSYKIIKKPRVNNYAGVVVDPSLLG